MLEQKPSVQFREASNKWHYGLIEQHPLFGLLAVIALVNSKTLDPTMPLIVFLIIN